MNIELREFQQTAVAKFVQQLRKAARDARDGDLQAVSLSSPTGSGKTVMLIEAIERILQGDDSHAPQPDATFLWLTDQPELNLQTRDKMLAFSTVLTPSTLTVLDAEFDAEQLGAGHVYFLNTQKLGKNSSLVAEGDRRQFSLWETLSRTVQARPGAFFVVIDEAHRGMAQSAQARNEANAIVQKLILGEPGQITPVPLVVGISATPERFNALIANHPRTTRPTVVEPADVRSSGLIKDAIQFTHPAETQPSDMTLLRSAVQSWQHYQTHWAEYCAEQGEEIVCPLLTVQVADATTSSISGTDLAQAIACIEDLSGTLPAHALAHAFQDKGALDIGGRQIRHLPPSEIAADPDVQVVFFKTSLTTGWDCPRAEVMMSFRTAADATNIAQLVGRMVRTPLVRRIEADEFLNTVALYLPHYDAAGLASIIKKLTEGDTALPTEVQTEPAAVLNRAPDSEALFDALAALPSYSVPRTPSANETKRLMRLALRLSMDKLRVNAPDQAKEAMLGVIDADYQKKKDTAGFQAIVGEKDTLDIRLVSYLYGEDAPHSSTAQQISVSAENIEDLFETAGRKVGEGLHKDWRDHRVEEGSVEPRLAKLELVALATPDLKRDMDRAAKEQARGWLTIYGSHIKSLPEKKRQAYEDIQGLAGEPEIVPLVYPQVMEAKREGALWHKHLYQDEQGRFQAKFNTWETAVLERELKRADLRGWLRVVPRKPWALTIPYSYGGKVKPVYIDFLIVSEGAEGLVVNIIDPHLPTMGEAAEKLSGLAHYAETHGEQYGRIESIILDSGGNIRRLDLQKADIRQLAKAVKTAAEVERLFSEAAVSAPTG